MDAVKQVDVTVISCLYGDDFDAFVPRWLDAIAKLTPAAAEVVLVTDRRRRIAGVTEVVRKNCPWKNPEAFYLDVAWRKAETTWVWIVNVDDLVLASGLEGIEEVDEDVWLTGFIRDDGVTHISPLLSNDDYLSGRNQYAAGSVVRVTALEIVGGFRDAAFQDWSLWRRLAALGARFATSGRVNYRYSQHPLTRTNRELTADRRAEHLAEMERV